MNSGDPHHDRITAGWKGRSWARHGQLAGARRQLLLSLPWLVFNFEWGALLIIMPSQIALIGGQANKVHNVGIILPLGAGNADFWLVLLTRSFMTMGSFTFLPFFAFFLRDAFQLPTNDDASQLFGLLLATTSALALPAALLGGRWADRHGPLREVRLGGWTTAACCMALAFVALRPGMASLLVVALVLAPGSALYQAVDWALAIAVLPSLGDAGRYMGIWHTSFVLPQTIAPFLASLLVGFDPSGAGSQAAWAYAVLFLLAAFWSICGTLPLRFIRSAR